MANTSNINIQNLKFEDIAQAYSGKNHKCCCGCSGKHYYSSKHVAESTSSHGYDISNRVNDKQVRRILKLVKETAARESDWENRTFLDLVGDEFVSAVVKNRLYIVYLCNAAQISGKI